MSKFAISDLHIGDGGPRDNFALDDNRERKFIDFLDYVDDNGELIIVGDLFELWQGNISLILSNRIKILDKLISMNVKYILGNHDIDFKYLNIHKLFVYPFFNNIYSPTTMVIGNKKFKFMHGHEFDQINNFNSPGWGRMMTIFAGLHEDHNGSPMLPDGSLIEERLTAFGENIMVAWNAMYNLFILIHNLLNKSAPITTFKVINKIRLDEHLVGAKNLKDGEGFDIGIFGHTHVFGKYQDWYYNSGSWSWIDNNFLEITDDGEVKMFNWTSNGPVENNQEIII